MEGRKRSFEGNWLSVLSLKGHIQDRSAVFSSSSSKGPLGHRMVDLGDVN
jgi:hypothetical protein